ncbi:DUF2281 domain-containing protein [Cyanobacterium sp. DS4]|uniref:DUF2281 domain-containing protein n=1 Tax=Cyanobacterium sp. DS4 TaxID=2878255 RepID=UPI002E802501|nr:DUF2281 domain-containing protein [Cyanobacterium sp. Dongsha4]WVL00043.1 DUF2281 domain-containing protein [Cyanobacterium sp. Dongsha4]
MTQAIINEELIMKKFRQLSPEKQQELLNFAEFLEYKNKKSTMNKENENINHESLEIWEIAEKISQQIPDQEWQKLPTDLSKNLDHYLSGSDKI